MELQVLVALLGVHGLPLEALYDAPREALVPLRLELAGARELHLDVPVEVSDLAARYRA